jgi:hypothetical protein
VGRAAVFFTPSLVSGRHEYEASAKFVIWDFSSDAAFVLPAGPAARGAGQVSTGRHDSVSLGMLIGGLAAGAVCVLLAMRHHRRHKGRSAASVPPGPARAPAGRP